MQVPHPWDLISGQPYIDADRLSVSLNGELQRNANPDFRTRLLVRDATNALESFWEHKDDIRVMSEKLDKEKIKNRLMTDGKAFLDDPKQRAAIEENWHFIFRENL